MTSKALSAWEIRAKRNLFSIDLFIECLFYTRLFLLKKNGGDGGGRVGMKVKWEGRNEMKMVEFLAAGRACMQKGLILSDLSTSSLQDIALGYQQRGL